jgi:hypothetical protein
VELDYHIAGRTLDRFHRSNARTRGIIGPIRSGKSTACCMEVLRRAHAQTPWHGARRSRWAVIRDTFGDLERTTIATWNSMFGQMYGRPVGRKAGIVHEIRDKLRDGTLLECDVIFFAMDHPDDANKLLSLELTGAYVNEARTTHRAIVDTLGDRVGQYPAKKDGGITWGGWWFDTNPPDDSSWIYELAEIEQPEGWEFFRQPGGLRRNPIGEWEINPKAENVENLNIQDGRNYYIANLPGKTKDHIKVMYGGEYGFLVDGKRVIHEFDDEVHTSKRVLEFTPGIPVYIGIDGGKTPAAAFLQRINGRWFLIKELIASKIGVNSFVKDMFRPALEDLLEQGIGGRNGEDFVLTADPAMMGDVESDAQVYDSAGIEINPAFTNEWGIRRDVLGGACSQLIGGQPRFLVSQACPRSRISLAKGYVLRKVGVDNHGSSRYELKPDKRSEHSHIGDAIMYAIMGSGEGRELLAGSRIADGPMPAKRLGSNFSGIRR